MKKEIVAMLLAGGVGSRLNILARHRAKPAIPFGGIYRIIDFTMSNIANSNIDVVGVLTQYKPLSLMEHLDNGRPWDLFGRTRLVEILPPKTGEEISDWYKGTSDAIYQNCSFIEDFDPELVLIVSGDHIYQMDYQKIIAFHKKQHATATICLVRVSRKDAPNFGIAEVDHTAKIIRWTEKPKEPKSDLASMGVYVFNKKLLKHTLLEVAKKAGIDFAKDVIPCFIKKKRCFGFIFNGYWRDVGTIDAYWNTSMDLLRKNSGLNIPAWQIKTNLAVKGEIGDRPAAYIGKNGRVVNSLIGRGCIIEGQVKNAIISPGVRIHRNAAVVNSIIFHDAKIGANTHIEKSIIDKDVKIGQNVVIGMGDAIPNQRFPHHLFTGITVLGKGAQIGANLEIGKNCIINPGVEISRPKIRKIKAGTTI